jgi:hypothetical protein
VSELSPGEFRAVADKVELTELLSRYHQTLDLLDFEGLRHIFTPDAHCAYLGLDLFGVEDVELDGVDAIIAWLDAGLGQLDNRDPKHFFANHVFDLRGDAAHTRSYMHGLTPHMGGVYDVDHVRTPEGWRIRNLRLVHITNDPKRRERARRGDG